MNFVSLVGMAKPADSPGARRTRVEPGVDPDHLTLRVEYRATGVAFIDRGPGLYEAVGDVKIAVERADNAGAHRAAGSRRIADRNYQNARF